MFARKSITAAVGLAVAATGIAATAAPAMAAPYVASEYDSVAAPVSADLIGVGSDTTMISVANVAKVWNADPANTAKIATFAGLPTADDLPLPAGSPALSRPKGSGDGVAALINPAVDFARSSGYRTDSISNATVVNIPFAMDHLGVAVKAGGPLAGLTLTSTQIANIFTGVTTNWNQIDAALGDHAIVKLGPASGGTHDFFQNILKSYTGNNSLPDYKTNLANQSTQEHDPAPIAADAYAIAPFSIGRASLPNASGIKILGGMDEKRAVYTVLRAADVTRPDLAAFTDFLCSPAADAAIKAGGLDQLADPDHGGVCGETASANVPVANLVLSPFVGSEFDTPVNAVSADLVGVGSDTTMISVNNAAKVWNTDLTNGAKVVSFAGLPTADNLPLPAGSPALSRPKGSGDGVAALINPAVDFARSSGYRTDSISNATVVNIPFAMDHLGVAVKAGGPLAGLTLTSTQIANIFTGVTTNWNQIDAALGDHAIVKLGPASGGTHDFFQNILKSYTGNNSLPDYKTNLANQSTQEHDPAPIAADAYAIAPFSIGRASLPNASGIKILGGMDEKRAVYTVLRAADVTRPDLAAFTDFLCSPAATQAITDGGLSQLADPDHGGVCGETASANVPVANLVTTAALAAPATSSVVASAAADGGTVTATATVTPSSAAGTVSFFEGSTKVGSGTVTNGSASASFGATAGAHTYTAKFVPSSAWSFAVSKANAPAVTVTGGPTQDCLTKTEAATAAAAAVVTRTNALTTATTANTKAAAAAKTAAGSKVTADTKVKSATTALTKAKKALKKAKGAAKKKAKKLVTTRTKALTTAKGVAAKAKTAAANAAAAAAKAKTAQTNATTAKAQAVAANEAAQAAKTAACAA